MNTVASTRRYRVLSQYPQWWLASLLLTLHGALAWGIDQWWSRALLLAHFGFFLLWQPWWGEERLQPRHVVLVAFGLLFAGWAQWWLVAVWIGVMVALIGGNVPAAGHRRLGPLIAAVYLLTLLLGWVVPHLFAHPESRDALSFFVRYLLPILPLVIFLIRTNEPSAAPFDLFYSVILFLLVATLVLGSFVVRDLAQTEYPMALAETLMVTAFVLLALGWLWNPHGGFAGLGQMLSRYLVSIGLPFEQWMQYLADLAEEERDPEAFLQHGLDHLAQLPWIAGVGWTTLHGSGEIGSRSQSGNALAFGDLALTVYTQRQLNPALLLHLKLLLRMLAHFYEAKQREEIQRRNAYTQAIHETGARLTHDVKNLLQSLKLLCGIGIDANGDAANDGARQALFARQLPQITQRLQTTLDKLKAPVAADKTQAPVAAANWWDTMQRRYHGRNVAFAVAGKLDGLMVPGDLFDSATDNLLQNALRKVPPPAGLEVRVRLDAADGGALTVSDNGAPVPPEVARTLFNGPVPSAAGFGVGLYQAARQAQRLGWRLLLAANEPGNVRFTLERNAGAR
jgi:signal transduction histidine kinase